VAQNYEKRMCEIVVPQNCDENTVVPTTEPTSEATEKEKLESGDCEEHVQSTRVSILACHLKIPSETLKHM
jgi:hypothetical protein